MVPITMQAVYTLHTIALVDWQTPCRPISTSTMPLTYISNMYRHSHHHLLQEHHEERSLLWWPHTWQQVHSLDHNSPCTPHFRHITFIIYHLFIYLLDNIVFLTHPFLHYLLLWLFIAVQLTAQEAYWSVDILKLELKPSLSPSEQWLQCTV